MAYELFNDSVHDQKRLHYLICVNQVAYAYLTSLQSKPSRFMHKELERSRKRYRRNTIAAVKHLDLSVRPDVTFFYALRSAVCTIMP
jgi:hypothetical protein